MRKRLQPSIQIPQFAYPGGKARLARRIFALLPLDADRYVEPFAGRGNVYFYVAAHDMYPSYWLNDIQTAPFLNTLRIGHILSVPPNSDLETIRKHRAIVSDKSKSPLQRNRAAMLESYLVFSGGNYVRSAGSRCNKGASQAGYSKSVRLASEILRGTGTRITRLDYKAVLAECGPGDVVYLDPPYMHTDVRAYSGAKFDYGEMVGILKDAKFRWVLSEYEQPIYIAAFDEPTRITVQSRMKKGQKPGGSLGRSVECLWKNF